MAADQAVTTGTVRIDTELASALQNELDGIIRDAKETLITGLPFDKYQQSCGMIEAYGQVRNVLIPQLLEAIQRR